MKLLIRFWMKKNGEKFSLPYKLRLPMISRDGMVRKGAIGEGKTKMSPEMLEELVRESDKALTPEQKRWMLQGGALP